MADQGIDDDYSLNDFDLSISKDAVQLIKTQAIATFNQMTQGKDDVYQPGI